MSDPVGYRTRTSSNNCPGTHRYYVADVAVVHDEGTVHVIALCLSCGDTKLSKHKVADGQSEIKLENIKREVNQDE